MLVSDQQYLAWQNKLAKNGVFGLFWKFFGLYGIIIYPALGVYFLTFPGGWKVVLLIAVSGLFAHYILAKLVHKIYVKQHPYQRLGFKPPWTRFLSLTDTVPDAFPSEHTITIMAICASIYMIFPLWGSVAFLVNLLIVRGRIIMGYHDWADVLAGFVLGLVSGYGVYWALSFLLNIPIR